MNLSSRVLRCFLSFCTVIFALTNSIAQQVSTIAIPMGGNAFIVQGTENGARITNNGLANWTDAKTITSAYFYAKEAGNISLFLLLNTPDGKSDISVKALGKTYKISTGSDDQDTVKVADLNITRPGYVRIDLQGIKKEGGRFANVQSLILKGNGLSDELAFVKDKKDFHFGRRGPSVHWNFKVPDKMKDNVEYFYNEIYVPKGQDVVGSYFEANGFSFGYFGMQVNSPAERRVLFSVWSPYDTNNPGEIPDDKKIHLVKKGADVHGGEFGGEGSGGQSFLKYDWKPDTHYAFLLKAAPDSVHNTTTFTAYFKKADEQKWLLIASFQRPHTNTTLKQLYSFLENFSPAMGNIQRRGYYTNQWVRSFDGEWAPVTQAQFTTDATGNAGTRMDYFGGVDKNGFYLENCGFFDKDGKAIVRKLFTREIKDPQPPAVDIPSLP